jgi:DNA-binding transcriptional LysR family regulator
MKISLDALLILDAIDRRGSFAGAAEELYRVPSSVTYSVQKLEQDLGIALFDRSGHRAVLTEAGEELLREGRHLLTAAGELEARVKRVASGYEAELRIAVSDLIEIPRLYPIIENFYIQNYGTRLFLLREVYGGTWDALVTGRADLAIGAPSDGPVGGGYTTHLLGTLEFVYAMAPHHPLASLPEPLSPCDIATHRAVAAADSSRNLPPRTSGILTGQDVFTVPDIRSKAEAHVHGLGTGYLPRRIAERYAAEGKLVIKQVAEPKGEVPFFLAWRSRQHGKSLQWFIDELKQRSIGDLMG